MKAYTAAVDAIRIQAISSAENIIEKRALEYARDPEQLDSIKEGLSRLRPTALLAYINVLSQFVRLQPRRYFGFGGEIEALNLAAARVYARRLVAEEAQRYEP